MLSQERPVRQAKIPAAKASPNPSAWRSVPSQSHQQKIRSAVLQAFVSNPSPDQHLQLQSLTPRQWRSLLRWLDVSGLALYFLDRLTELQLSHILPNPLFARLRQNMQDNAVRTRSMLLESAAIQEEFQKQALSYAVLKGVSFFPESVPRLELRHQFDLDFLIAEQDIAAGQRVLEQQGYRLYAVSGRSWEFKKDEKIGVSMEEFYKDTSGRTVELHIQAHTPTDAPVLSRVVKRRLYGVDMPVLSPVDLFLGQAMHAYKHICGEFSRTAHLLELYRHVLTRRQDDLFWSELRSKARKDPKIAVRLGVVILLLTNSLGNFAPPALTEWTVDRLTPAVRLWVKLYGPRAVFGDVPGSKLYLLLQREIESPASVKNSSLVNALLPHRLPPAVVRAAVGESASTRLRRYRLQLNYALLRFRFHLVEGLRYGWEAYRWNQQKKGWLQ